MTNYTMDRDFIKGGLTMGSMRKSFGHALVEVAKKDERVVALTADLGSSVGLAEFADQLPDRFIETGIAEQDLVTIASGMARVGKIPFAASYAAFNPGRNWEQIRTTVALNNMPVKIVGSHTGLNVGPDGATHQMLEDIALMRVIPNMVVLAPGDAIEAGKMAQAMVNDERPNYIRLPRADFPTYSTPDSPFQIGKAYVVRPDDEASITMLSTGTMTGQALLASEILSRDYDIATEVVHVPTVKPLDRSTILEAVGRNSIAVTVEEHQVAGGFGSAIAELLLESNVRPTVFRRFGVDDRFGQSGTADELLSHYRLDAAGIVSRILQLLQS